MGYADGEALILTLVKENAYFDSTNSSRGNWQLLNKGRDRTYAVLRPGSASFTDDSIGLSRARVRTWRTQVLVYHRYIDDGTTATGLQTIIGSLLTTLESETRLGDTGTTIRDAQVVGVEPMQEILDQGGGPLWLLWPINIDWQENV